jgi:hypothetical protein
VAPLHAIVHTISGFSSNVRSLRLQKAGAGLVHMLLWANSDISSGKVRAMWKLF